MKTKIFFSTLLSFYFCLLSSQIPQGFNYQAIARYGSGDPITTTIQVKIGFQTDTLLSAFIWEELHPTVKPNSQGLFSLAVGTGSRVSGALKFSDVDWTKTPVFMKTFISTGGPFTYMGAARLWSVPYSLIAGELGGAVSKLEVLGEDISSDEALFEVKRKDGKTMFAVYNHGVRVYMPLDTLSKGRKGGFAIGGFSSAKEDVIQDYFVVNPDSIRAYIDSNPVKARKGGFAIGSFDRSKAENIQKYLTVSSDSVRIYIDDNLSKAGRKGGFAIGSFDASKAGKSTFFDVSPNTGDIIASQNRILWYPEKNAFLTGKIIIEHPDSVGENSFSSGYESRAKGDWSQALGYKAIARGDYSTAIGKNAVAKDINSFAFGEDASADNIEAYAIGRGAVAGGYRSFAFGSSGIDLDGFPTEPTYAIGDYSVAIGQGAVSLGNLSIAFGFLDTAYYRSSIAIGSYSSSRAENSLAIGNENIASDPFTISIGFQSVATKESSLAIGTNNFTSGVRAIAIGNDNRATGHYSTALGYGARAIGSGAMAVYENYAIGGNSIALGDQSISRGTNSIVVGRYLISKPYGTFAIGQFNDTTVCNSGSFWIGDDPLFIIGNGTSNSSRKNAVTVLKNGNVGIGTSTPSQKLYVDGTIYASSIQVGNSFGPITSNWWEFGTDNNNGTGIDFHSNSSATDYSSRIYRGPGNNNEFQIVNTGTGNLAFYNNNTFAMAINNSGNVGIGTSTPGYKLDVAGNTRIQESIQIGNSRGPIAANYWEFGTDTNNDTYIDFHSNTSSVDYSARIDRRPGNNGDFNFVNVGTGVLHFYYNNGATYGTYDATGWHHTSDIRLKENIESLSGVLASLTKLRGIKFNFISDPLKKKQTGLIAQDVEVLFPELVSTDENGYKSIGYDQVSVLLIEAIKEQQQQIESQQQQIDQLRTMVEELKNR